MAAPKTDRDKLMKGVKLIALAFPFIISAPIVLTIAFDPEQGTWWLTVLAVILILSAFFFGGRGLLTIISAFFDRPS